jgi:uncharacterized tellurite resistance protein B-like protein
MEPRLAHCHLLAEVLAADGKMTDEERQLLDAAMQRLGLDEHEREQVRVFHGAEGAAAALLDRPEEERRALVDELVEAALVDGKLTPTETAAVKRIAAALGLD